MKCLRWISTRMEACKVDNALLERSAAARTGRRLIQAAVLLRSVEPILLLIVMATLLAAPALAQPGGNIFGGNDQQLGTGVREAIRWGRNLLFLLGVGGIGWATINYMTEKSWGKQAVGGGMAMGLGGIASLIYSFSQGNAVNLNTDLGN